MYINHKLAYKKYTENHEILIDILKLYLDSASDEKKVTFSFLINLIKHIESANLNSNFLSKNGTPFLMASLSNLVSLETDDIKDVLFNLFFLLFDSYSVYLCPFKIQVDTVVSRKLYLPNFGMLSLEEGSHIIEKNKNEMFFINGKDFLSEKITLDIGNGSKFLIGTAETYKSLFRIVDFSYLSTIEYHPIDKIDVYLQKLRSALIAISIGDFELYTDINHLIKFYVPLKDMKRHSRSFTLRPYIGVTFLSFNTDILAIAENIIREYGNTLLNININFDSLIKGNDELYYSPYSQELSTPFDLLANAFIFIMVIKFFSACLSKNEFEKDFPLIKYRFNVQVSRLSLAFMQIAKIEFTSEGNKLIADIKKCFLEIKTSNVGNLTKTPEIIFKQLEEWKKKYPDLSHKSIVSNLIEDSTSVDA